MTRPGLHRSIRWKLGVSFLAVAAFVAAFAGVAIAIHFATVERAAQPEAEHGAGLIAEAVGEGSTHPAGRLAA